MYGKVKKNLKPVSYLGIDYVCFHIKAVFRRQTSGVRSQPRQISLGDPISKIPNTKQSWQSDSNVGVPA
jgi:hypothetical protein